MPPVCGGVSRCMQAWSIVCPSGFGARRKPFFFEKKNQKTFAHSDAYWGIRRVHQRTKVFCCFFSKKKYFLSYSRIIAA
jgi:hypothetical protein